MSQTPYLLGEKPQTLSRYAQTVLERSTRPKTSELALKKMELETQRQIERIRAQKELEIARLEAQAKKKRYEAEKELALQKIRAGHEERAADRRIVGWAIALGTLFLLLSLWVVMKLFKEYHAHKRRLEEDRMRHEKELKEKELQTRLVEKMFDALGSGQLDEEQKNRLLERLEAGPRHLPMIDK